MRRDMTDKEEAMVEAVVDAIQTDRFGKGLRGIYDDETAFAVMFVSAIRAIGKFEAE